MVWQTACADAVSARPLRSIEPSQAVCSPRVWRIAASVRRAAAPAAGRLLLAASLALAAPPAPALAASFGEGGRSANYGRLAGRPKRRPRRDDRDDGSLRTNLATRARWSLLVIAGGRRAAARDRLRDRARRAQGGAGGGSGRSTEAARARHSGSAAASGARKPRPRAAAQAQPLSLARAGSVADAHAARCARRVGAHPWRRGGEGEPCGSATRAARTRRARVGIERAARQRLRAAVLFEEESGASGGRHRLVVAERHPQHQASNRELDQSARATGSKSTAASLQRCYYCRVRSQRASELSRLAEEVSACRRCPRLVAWREQVARERRAAFADEEYWGRPLPGFGDPARARAAAGSRAGGARRQPHRAHVHRRPLRRLPVRGAVAHRLRQPAARRVREETASS